MNAFTQPGHSSYDVVIIGGAMIGSSVAWFLSDNSDFNGRILVIEKDPSYEFSSTARTNSCIRQQFSNEINIRISRYAAEFIEGFRQRLGGDPDIPDIAFARFGYMYFADDAKFAAVLADRQKIQHQLGAGTKIMTPAEINAAYPFYNLEGILCGSHNPVDEGYFDGSTMFDWWKRKARQNGVEFIANEAVAITRINETITGVTLACGQSVSCGYMVNAAGPNAAIVAGLAGMEIPVEPRKRYTFLFDAETKLDQVLPLTIDPSGVHFRAEGNGYMAGCPPEFDRAVDPDDFEMDHAIWEDRVWPALAKRVPAFEAVKVQNTWAGHYAYNVLDQNAVIGPHSEVANFIFVNGFSGHGLQQSPAMGRGVSELITYGEYRELDLSPLSYDRIAQNRPLLETAVI